jgi:hypothetical protein
MMGGMPMRGVGVGAGGPSKLKVIGGGILAVVVAIGYGALRMGSSFLPKAGHEKISNLGIDQKKADPDKMIAAAAAYAKKWKSDAGFWSVTIQKLGADGTVDLSQTNVVVEYFSPSAVSSPLPTTRNDSIKKFNFIGEDMDYTNIWGVTKQYNPAPKATAIPGCTAKQLAAKLVQLGILKPGASTQVSIDPAFGDQWLVQTGSVPRSFDLGNCAEKK